MKYLKKFNESISSDKMEIERKFLPNHEKWNTYKKENNLSGENYSQGYILSNPKKTVRIRNCENDAFITIKGEAIGASKPEYEYSIPQKDAIELLKNFCETFIEKTRYKAEYGGKLWEVDEFHGKNEGLILVEVELESENEEIEIPDWIEKEVTDDVRYFNSNLAN